MIGKVEIDLRLRDYSELLSALLVSLQMSIFTFFQNDFMSGFRIHFNQSIFNFWYILGTFYIPVRFLQTHA